MSTDAALWILLGLVVLQRLSELRLARRNTAWARKRGAVETGAGHYPAFFVLHTAWLVAWATEASWGGVELSAFWPGWLAALVLAQAMRYWAIVALGRRWNTRILVFPGVDVIRRGPYRFLRHPNYLAVAIEVAVAPMMFGAWITAAVVTGLNAVLLLGVRIPAERRALDHAISPASRRQEPSTGQAAATDHRPAR